jgi:hypothetical protein
VHISGNDDIPSEADSPHRLTPEGDVMPILRRAPRPAEPYAASPVQAVRVSRAWSVSPLVLALIVFTMFWAQTTMLVALVVGLAAAVGSTFLLTLMFGPAWITRRRRRASELRRYR